MTTPSAAVPIEADYLVVGAGAVGMAFADTLLSETDATIAIVDARDRPGGHWNDAYSFVRLHQPSASYGVNSRPLGSGRIDDTDLNRGMFELASGAELVGYYDGLMRDRFLPSGRVQYFPMSSYSGGTLRSLVSGEPRVVRAGKIVDGTLNNTSVPSRHRRNYAVAPGMICVPPNDLPRLARPDAQYVIVGAGKTAMDAAFWLLDNGARPETIRWIVPRDSWLLDRAHFQPGRRFIPDFVRSGADQVEALARATSISDLFARLEACGEIRRIDPKVMPTAYHCATLSDGELRQLRRLEGVVRMGRVKAIEPDRIVLEHGTVPTGPEVLHIDCTANGIPRLPEMPVFDGDRINLLWIRTCQPVFSAALIAHVEASYSDDDKKNWICGPIPSPQEPVDWLRMIARDLVNRRRWAAEQPVADWLATGRLNPFAPLMRDLGPEEAAEVRRYEDNVAAAEERAITLLSQLDGKTVRQPEGATA